MVTSVGEGIGVEAEWRNQPAPFKAANSAAIAAMRLPAIFSAPMKSKRGGLEEDPPDEEACGSDCLVSFGLWSEGLTSGIAPPEWQRNERPTLLYHRRVVIPKL